MVDLKDAFHSLRLSEKSKKYCGILPYFGSVSYLYQRMPMGLNVSPPIWKELQYMGKTIFIQEKNVCVNPLHSRLKAIQKLRPPTTVKGCRSFVGMVNFLSIFCQDLQKTFKTHI